MGRGERRNLKETAMATTTRWRETSLDSLEAERPAGRWAWATDGVLGYARPLAAGETAAEAAADFGAAGEPCVELRVYRDGEWVE
jgi:hypothetical protein